MNRKEVSKIMKSSFRRRKAAGLPILDWEHSCKSFQMISNNVAAINMTADNKEDPIILKCEYNGEVYYIGAGLEDEEITVQMLKNGKWYVYTWED